MLNMLTQAKLRRFVLDLGPDVEEFIGHHGSVEAQLNRLISFTDGHPGWQRDDGTPIEQAIIDKAVELLLENYPWHVPTKNEAALLRALERDGYTVSGDALRRMLPAELELPEAETEIERLLAKHGLNTAKGHLDQARDAHARGDWAASNSQVRTFFDAVLDGIAEKLDPTAASLSSGQPRRQRLAKLKFLIDPHEWEGSGKGFINGLVKRLHPEGPHPGLSDEEDSTFRLHIVMITARLLLKRLDGWSTPALADA